MPRHRSWLVVGGLAVLALVASACSSSSDNTAAPTTVAGADPSGSATCAAFEGSGSFKVGSTNFSEQEIVAELYAQCMEAAGYTVERKFKLGAREVVFPGLERGDVDLYPEYLGSLLTHLGGTPTSDYDQTVADLEAALDPRGIRLLEPSDAEDKNGFAVTQETAQKHKLTTLSDLRGVAGQLVFGAGPECPERPLCLPGLKEVYGLEFKEVTKLDTAGVLTKNALANGDIDVGLVLTSDGAVPARGFVILEDDRNLQPPENLAPAVRADRVTPDLEELLDTVSALLTTEDLAEMNRRVDVDKADPATVAETWLRDNGLIP